jgi:hypothetical protein
MQSANLHQIKAAIRDQAFTGRTWVSCTIGAVVAVRTTQGPVPGDDTRLGWTLVSRRVRAD